jgi:hypothetical protein
MADTPGTFRVLPGTVRTDPTNIIPNNEDVSVWVVELQCRMR